MIDFGTVINLQPSILGWLVNGENSDLAFREMVSSRIIGNNTAKNMYRGNIIEFMNNYMKPSNRDGSVDFYSDRQPYYTAINKGRILNSLLEYKKRWNIEGDNAKLKIDHVSIKGKWITLKTTESALQSVFFGIFNGTTSTVEVPDLSLSNGVDLAGNVDLSYDILIPSGPTFSNAYYTPFGYGASEMGIYSSFYVPSSQLSTGSETLVTDMEGSIYGVSGNMGSRLSLFATPDNVYTFDFEGTTLLYLNRNTWYNIRLLFDISTPSTSMYINDTLIAVYADSSSTTGLTEDIEGVISGYMSPRLEFIEANIKNVKVIVGDVIEIDIQDPSTGVNIGEASDGTVIDVTQGGPL